MNAQTDAAAGLSPYERVLGGSMRELHPRLRAYFSAIPPGHVGYGRGTFDVVGTSRRVLWQALAILGRLGVAFPVHEFHVPFSVENRRAGPASVGATRRFGLHGGTRAMWDVMHETRGRLVERFDEATQSQHVDVTLVSPLLGRLYEYSGSFTYEMRPEGAA